MAHLVVSKGHEPGSTIHLAKVTCLGRGLDMDVRLDELTVSKRHARIIRDDRGEYILEDLASSNGTFLNGVEITTKPLKDGDEVRIGASIFVFHKSLSDTSYIGVEEEGKLIDIDQDNAPSSVVSRVDMSSEGGTPAAGPTPADTTVEELVKTNYRLRTLLEIVQSIGGALDENELLNRIVDKLFEVFPETNRGFIILREPDTGRLTPRAQRISGSASASEERLQISETILDYVLEQKQAILSTDLMSDERLPTSQSILNLDMRSVMCAPLLYENEVLGFIQLDTSRIANNYDDDGLHLLAGIANQAALTIANARLHGELVKRERLEQDLRNARRIQTSFLPKEPPNVTGYSFANYYGTAIEVGGDFYDTVAVGDGQVLITVGDVSGKGISAALMMAAMASNVRFFAGARLGPADLLRKLNEAALGSETDMFVTVLVMYLDREKHTVRMCNAGHCYPMRRAANGQVDRIEAPNGFPVGITADADFPETTFEVAPGDVICLFTDGVIEAMDMEGKQFGYKTLARVMQSAAGTPGDVVQAVQRAIREHAGGAPQSDDLTLVCFSRQA
jgi:serine phosphatase RsbU (regulator of sigma subunit)/pSer/pThr/pTyr-binding forkhead associated (FHA) protein